MAFSVDNFGNITLVQGDSGELVINGIPTDDDYSVYLAIQDEKRNPVGNEISVNSSKSPSVVFVIPASLTNLLEVKKNEEIATYYYGVKLCDESGLEDTMLLGNSDIGDRNTITVYPKKVEGLLQ